MTAIAGTTFIYPFIVIYSLYYPIIDYFMKHQQSFSNTQFHLTSNNNRNQRAIKLFTVQSLIQKPLKFNIILLSFFYSTINIHYFRLFNNGTKSTVSLLVRTFIH